MQQTLLEAKVIFNRLDVKYNVARILASLFHPPS